MIVPRVAGCGVVSAAGWGLESFREALAANVPLPAQDLPRPGVPAPMKVRSVPALSPRPAFLGHPRLRRTSPIAHYTVAAALEALGDDAAAVREGKLSLGIVVCVMTACVIYSRRFYDETLKDPSTASPLVFPETVFNAPASHLAAFLGSTAINYTLVGDPTAFIRGLAIAADWLVSGRVQACLVVGSEEADWITSEALQLFDRRAVMGEGAGAIYLPGDQRGGVQLTKITNPQPYTKSAPRRAAAERVRHEILNSLVPDCLCDSLQGLRRVDATEEAVWADFKGKRVSPRKILGEGLMAASAWQCVAAIDAIRRGESQTAVVNVVGCNEAAIAAEFARA